MGDHWNEFCQYLQDDDPRGVERLIDDGFSPDSSHSKSGSTALETAAKAGREDVVKILLEAGAKPNTQFDFLERASGRILKGRTALMHAANERVVKTLVSHGADPSLCDASGLSALRHFILQRSQTLVSALVPSVPEGELVAAKEFLRGKRVSAVIAASASFAEFVSWVAESVDAELARRNT